MSSWDVLERHFGGLTADEVDAALVSLPAQGATPTSAPAAAYLAEHGGPDLDGEARPGSIQKRRALTAARTLSQTLRSSATADEAAAMLGISRSRVSHRISDRTLWAFTVHGRRYLPRWQFLTDSAGETSVLPGLADIVPAIPRGVHPAALAAFMTSPHNDFAGASPAEWIASGGDPALLADWLAGMAHG